MALLIAGLALFWAAHGLKISFPAKRAELAEKYGQNPIKLGATVLILLSVVMIVLGYQGADFINVWFPPAWMIHLNNLLMLIAVVVFIAGTFKSWIRDKIRHPQLTGVKIWAAAHLLVNGDLASIILFGTLLAWAVTAVIAINKRDGKPARGATRTTKGTIFNIVGGLLVFGIITFVHGYLGVSPFPGGA
ncbi:NnrU family protein [Rhodobacteraceae bacterium NNCM2]|nr:NnrU family protein [Coraliihabitans acroporae]